MSDGRIDRLAEAIWNASRADEGTISATGAKIVAQALRPLLDEFAAQDRAAADARAARDQRRYESLAETLHKAVLRAEAAERRLSAIEALAAEWERDMPAWIDPIDGPVTELRAVLRRADRLDAPATAPLSDAEGERGGEGQRGGTEEA